MSNSNNNERGSRDNDGGDGIVGDGVETDDDYICGGDGGGDGASVVPDRHWFSFNLPLHLPSFLRFFPSLAVLARATQHSLAHSLTHTLGFCRR